MLLAFDVDQFSGEGAENLLGAPKEFVAIGVSNGVAKTKKGLRSISVNPCFFGRDERI